MGEMQERLTALLEQKSQAGGGQALDEASVEKVTREFIDENAQSGIDALLGSSTPHREYQQRKLDFETGLSEKWGKALDRLELFVLFVADIGDDFNKRFGAEAKVAVDRVFEALTRLHAKACTTAFEVLTLLRAGFADGAQARWRSLHEIAVFSAFIRDHGQETADRFLLHDVIDQYKLAIGLNKFAERLGEDQIAVDNLAKLKIQRDELIGKFGAPFGNEYGWAAPELRSERPSIALLEEKVGLDHWRPQYRTASDNVHPSAHGIYVRLGLPWHLKPVLLAGPSEMGLASPGHSTAISLSQTTTALLRTVEATADSAVYIKVLSWLTDAVGEEFLSAHRHLEILAQETGPASYS